MNYWEILEIRPTTDEKEIKEAYANLIQTNHPEDDERKFMRIREAYQAALNYARFKKSLNKNNDLLIDNDKTSEQTEIIKINEEKSISNNNFEKLKYEISFKAVESFIEYCDPIDVTMIDRFWVYVDNASLRLSMNQKAKWKAITTQWYFSCYRDNLYFQDRLWEFFKDLELVNIKNKTRFTVIYPFLIEMMDTTNAEVKIKHDVIGIVNRYLTSFKLSNVIKPKQIIEIVIVIFIGILMFAEFINYLLS